MELKQLVVSEVCPIGIPGGTAGYPCKKMWIKTYSSTRKPSALEAAYAASANLLEMDSVIERI